MSRVRGARRPAAVVAVVALAAASLGIGAPVAPSVAAAAPADADVLAGAASFGSSAVYPDVAAGGGGLFHAVVRDSSLGTRIIYLRSRDGGRNWTRSAVLSGTVAATRPAIAADGEHVAVAFVGDWTDASGGHGEAPYLTTSDDGGSSWTPARRLGTWATDVDVAVDGDRVWVTWGGTGGIRGTTDGGATFFVSQNLTGVVRALVAAGDGVVSSAYLDGAGDTMLAVGQGQNLGAFQRVEHAVLQDVGAADGLAYTLVADGGRLSVLAASPGGAAARAPVPTPPGGAATSTNLWADLAAGRGTLAVATCAAGTAFVTESTDWPNFSAPVAVTTFAGAGDCRATITAPAPAAELEPRFEWTVAPHYTDTDGDGLPEPTNLTGTSVDNVLVGANDTLRVTLDGCASLPAGGGVPISRYLWSVNGAQVADLDHCAGPTIEVRSGARPQVRLEVRDDQGGRAVTSRAIDPRDLVVVSLGDSVASGEGSPLRASSGGAPAVWSDPSCHRSPYAGPALAARELEDADPHTAVTFVQLACSGAAIVDTFADPAHQKAPTDPDDPVTGGLDDAYAGVQHADTCTTPGGACPSLRPSQLAQMTQLLGARTADAVLVSVGANDVRFSGTLEKCLVPVVDCHTGGVAAAHDTRMAQLPARYARLAAGLEAAGVAPDRVHITEYFDPTGDGYGVPDLRCIGHVQDITGISLVTGDEAVWARDHVVAGLNGAVRAAANEHGWDVVGGIAAQFVRHGYCADDPWIVGIAESALQQSDLSGPFHPNRAGQEVYGDAIYSHLAPLVQVAPTGVAQGVPTGAASVGDLVVLASDVWAPHPQLRSAALTTTGGVPTVGAVRVLQQGAGWGAVALDHDSSVGVWAGEYGGFGAQLGSRPNATVRAVHLVQAPADGSRLVTNRKTGVLADLWSSVDGAWTARVTTSVTARADGNETQVLAPVTEDVVLFPGRNDVLLPVADTFSAPEGTTLVATVTVTDPAGAAEEDGADNELSTAPGDFVPTIATRPLKIAFVPLDFGGGTVGCGDIADAANTWVAWAQQLLPVPDGGVLAELSCLPELLAPTADPDGVATALAELDLLARESGLDSVVGIVPDGWLGGALGDGSVGRAGVTGRSVLLEQHAPETALAHELGHNLGLEHTEPTPASGAWVSRNRVIDGIDFMTASQDGISRYWVGGDTWDLLTSSLAPGTAPTQPAPGGSAYWVRGSLPIGGDTLNLDPFLDDGDVPGPPPPDSDTGRLTVVPVAADGSPTGPAVAIGLTDAESEGGSGTTTQRFAQRVVAPPGTAAFRFLLDGAVAAERALGSAPTVAVTAPEAGTALARDDTIHVAWTVTDPDTADGSPVPAVTLLVSDDDGASWRPLASGLTGTSADLPVPRDLGGDHVRIRVVASDGVHLRWADSPTFAVAAVPTPPADRVVFVAGDPDRDDSTSSIDGSFQFPVWDRIGTMRPDGSDVQFLPVPATAVLYGSARPAQYSSPVWGADGRIYFGNIETVPALNGNACLVVDSVQPDGSDLRREISPTNLTECNDFRVNINAVTLSQCLSMTPDGNRLLLNYTVFERDGTGWRRAGDALALRDNADVRSGFYGLYPFDPSSQVSMASNQCPVLSPDGTHVARAASLFGGIPNEPSGSGTHYGSELGVVVAPVLVAGQSQSPWMSSARFVSAWDETLYRPLGDQEPDLRALGVSWRNDHELLVTRGAPGWDQARVESLDLSTLTPVPVPDPGDVRLEPAAATPLGTAALPASSAVHRDPKLTPDGRVYGDIDCGLYVGSYTGALAVTTYHSPYVVGSSTCYRDFSWNGTAMPGGGGGGDPMIDIDPALAPDPAPDEPGPPQVVAAGTPSPGAGTDATRPVPDDVLPDSVTISPGEVLDLVLSNDLGAPVRYEIDPVVTQPPGGGTVTVLAEPDRGTGLLTTSGPLRLQADQATASASGPARVRVRAAGAASFDTIEVRIAVPSRPTAADDALVVRAGTAATFPASALLANDAPGRAGAQLELVQVDGYDRGSAFLDADGVVHVVATAAGTGTFHYSVAESGSTAVATGVVTVTARSAPPPALALTLSATSAYRGDRVTVTGTGFLAGELVDGVVHSGAPVRIGAARADRTGRVVLTWTVPATLDVGEHTVILTGAASGTVEHGLRVLGDRPAPATDGVGPLATTGADIRIAVSVAVGLLLGGAMLLLAARAGRPRRRGGTVRAR